MECWQCFLLGLTAAFLPSLIILALALRRTNTDERNRDDD